MKTLSQSTLYTGLVHSTNADREEMVRFEHLESLEHLFTDSKGQEHTGWIIYACPVDDKNPRGAFCPVLADGEGYCCVDDAARVAQVYLSYYERTGEEKALEKARQALDFILYLADEKGDFYNFIDINGIINKKGGTSRPDLDWWTARAFYALGKGIRILSPVDPSFVETLLETYLKTLDLITWRWEHHVVSNTVLQAHQRLGIIPGHLINESGAITSLVVLGLLEGYRTLNEPRIRELITLFCNAMARLEERSAERYPFTGLHYPTLWNLDMIHLYGNRQVQALAEAGQLFHNDEWIASAVREADIAYPRILTSWGLPFAFSPEPEEFPQLPYSAETVISNLMAVHRATGEQRFAVLAGLFTAWFFGNNPFSQPVCIPEKGRCFDGIDPQGVSVNAGAESVIEALMALETIQGTPAEGYIYMKPDADEEDIGPVLVNADRMTVLRGTVEYTTRTMTGSHVKQVVRLSGPAEVCYTVKNLEPVHYRLYLSYRFNVPGDTGELEVHTGEKQETITLLPSGIDSHFRITPAGDFTVDAGANVTVVIKQKHPDQEVIISSLILQPDIQKKTWSDGVRRYSLVANISQ